MEDFKVSKRYFDKNGREITNGCKIKRADGIIYQVYLSSTGELGTDATNPKWIKSGRACECEYGIYPFTTEHVEDAEVVD